jgi:hypothetical protein
VALPMATTAQGQAEAMSKAAPAKPTAAAKAVFTVAMRSCRKCSILPTRFSSSGRASATVNPTSAPNAARAVPVPTKTASASTTAREPKGGGGGYSSSAAQDASGISRIAVDFVDVGISYERPVIRHALSSPARALCLKRSRASRTYG